LIGPGAREVLAKGCTLDLHPDEFKPGACAQSGLAKASVLLAMIDERPSFEIKVRRSFAEYVLLWLNYSGREFGISFL
jgi:sarcosine oxidase subunit gamma